MKKKILFLLVALSSLVFVSCSDNDDEGENPLKGKQVSKITCVTTDDGETNISYLEYDDKGRVIKEIYNESQSYTDVSIFTYGNDIITLENTYGEKKDVTTYHLSNGIITSSTGHDNATYSYNDKNELTKIVEDSYTSTYTWKDGNVITQNSTWGENTHSSVSYTYSTNENKIIGTNYLDENIPNNILFNYGYFGTKNKNLMTSEQNDNYKSEFEYEFDNDEYVIKEHKYRTYKNTENKELHSTLTYEYN